MVAPLIRKILFIAVCILAVSGSGYSEERLVVRVAVVQDAASLSLKVSGPFEVLEAKRGVLYRGRGIKTTVTSYKGGILFAGKAFQGQKIIVRAQEPEAIVLNGRRFRGALQFVKSGENKLLAVNEIGLEDYVKGILYHEVSHYWPMEALKAQAIACRTYALYQMQENKAKDFDVTSDVFSQVYGGRASERYRTNRAVEESAGLVVMYRGKVIPAYYHATCAGHTEDASLLWNTDLPPLKGVECPFCKESPHFSWHYVISLQELKDALAGAGYRLAAVKGIKITGRTASGRVAGIAFTDGDKEITLSGKDFRALLGHNLIRSAKFNVSISGGDAVFEGTGWGHGVGMCQWGAYFMAKQGRTAEEILAYYYPGADVKAF